MGPANGTASPGVFQKLCRDLENYPPTVVSLECVLTVMAEVPEAVWKRLGLLRPVPETG